MANEKDLIVNFLRSLPYAKLSSDRHQLMCRCPFCGDSRKDKTHTNFSIKLAEVSGDAFLYKCFRSECDKSGLLTTDTLQLFGCNDPQILNALATWNSKISKKYDSKFKSRKAREFQIVNVRNDYSRGKLAYVNKRLGMNWDFGDLAQFRIQLSIYDFIRGNRIKKLAYSKQYVDVLDTNCIGFISMYQDYAILRDCTRNITTGRRYHMYRTSGDINKNDTKVYAIPTEISLLEPSAADINVAEGVFSLLGAYLHTPYGRDARNVLFLANCGSEYRNTILSVCAQYGLVKINLHLWADSEVPVKKFVRIYKQISSAIKVEHCVVYYNRAADDFGHPAHEIKTEKIVIA